MRKLRKFLSGIFISALMFCLLAVNALADQDVWVNPGPYPVGMDTWFGSYYNKTAQHDTRLRVGGWGDEYDTLVRFDLSGMPQVANQVVLWMYAQNEASPTNIYWYFLTNQWQSGSVSWGTRPSGNYLGWTNPPTSNSWYGVIFTNQYNQWRSGNLSTLNYGLKLRPMYNNNRYSTFYSSTQGIGYSPRLQITYTPTANDDILQLKWPLSTAKGLPTQVFGVNWSGGGECPTGVIKKHNGADYSASTGTAVYAAEDGIVKEVYNSGSDGWASAIVIEHNQPGGNGAKYTTVYWHVNPATGIVEAPAGQQTFVPKGMQIGNVADLTSYNHTTHFHFGIRMGEFLLGVSETGALPQSDCGGDPAFPEYFVDPEDSSAVSYQ